MPLILVADDDPANRRLLVTLLRYGGYDVVEAADGAQALEVARTSVPDLIVMDLHMPKMNGVELVKALRSSEEFTGTKVALYTATAENASMRQFMEVAGIGHVIPKPSEPEDVLRIVKDALGATSS